MKERKWRVGDRVYPIMHGTPPKHERADLGTVVEVCEVRSRRGQVRLVVVVEWDDGHVDEHDPTGRSREHLWTIRPAPWATPRRPLTPEAP